MKKFSDLTQQNVIDTVKFLTENSDTPDNFSFSTGLGIFNYLKAKGFITETEIEQLIADYPMQNPFDYFRGFHIKLVSGLEINEGYYQNYHLPISLKTLTPFEQGDNKGCLVSELDSGKIYFGFLIKNTINEVDYVVDDNQFCSNIPTGWTNLKLLHSFKTNNLVPVEIESNTILQPYEIDIFGLDGVPLVKDYISNFNISRNNNTTVKVSPLSCRDSENKSNIKTNVPLYLDVSTVQNNKLYYIFVSSNYGELPVLELSTSSTNSGTNYNNTRFIGFLRTADYITNSEYNVWRYDDLVERYRIVQKTGNFDFFISDDINKTIIYNGTAEGTMNLEKSTYCPDDGLLRGYYIANQSNFKLKIWINGGTENFVTGLKSIVVCPNKKVNIGVSALGWDLITNCDVFSVAAISDRWKSTNFDTLTTIPVDTKSYIQNEDILEIDTVSHRIIAKVNYVILISFEGFISSTSSSNYIVTFRIFKNGSDTGQYVTVGSGDREGTQVTKIDYPFEVNAGDYFEIKAVHNGNLTGYLEYFNFKAKTNI